MRVGFVLSTSLLDTNTRSIRMLPAVTLILPVPALCTSNRLHTVDLWDNKISGRGATAFLKVVTKNKNIKTINLGKNVLDMNAKTGSFTFHK